MAVPVVYGLCKVPKQYGIQCGGVKVRPPSFFHWQQNQTNYLPIIRLLRQPISNRSKTKTKANAWLVSFRHLMERENRSIQGYTYMKSHLIWQWRKFCEVEQSKFACLFTHRERSKWRCSVDSKLNIQMMKNPNQVSSLARCRNCEKSSLNSSTQRNLTWR